MLIHTILITDQPALGRRLRDLLELPDVVLTLRGGDALWEVLAGEPCDLLLLDQDCLPEPAVGVVSTIRKLPEGPEIVFLQGARSARERTALLAAGCLAVVDRDLDDEALEPMFAALVDRRRGEIGRAHV